MKEFKAGIFIGLLAMSVSLPALVQPACAAGALKKRSEIDQRYQWKLSDIYPSMGAWDKDWQSAKALGASLAKYEGTLVSSPDKLLSFLKKYEEACIKLDKLTQYASMNSDQDTAISSFNSISGKADSLSKEISAKTAFFSPEISKLSEKKLSELITKYPKLRPFRQLLSDIVRRAKHTLPKEQEALLAQAGEAMSAPENAFKMLNNADLVFPTMKDEQGNDVELTKGRYTAFMESEDRSVRKNAYEKLLETFKGVNGTMASLMNSEVKVHVFNRTVRKYPTAMAAALDNENIPVSVYNSLVSSVEKGLPALHRYYALRKRIMNLPELHAYDTSVALVPGVKMEFSYDQANEIIQKALSPLGAEYVKIYDKGIKSGWVDVYENKGKRSGAYSWGPYSVHPYVLHNWSDTYWGMSTMAHEMGHAINRYYSQAANNYFNAENPIFTAEVASQTNEILLMEYQLKHTTDKKQKLYLLTQFANGIIGSVYRQTQYAEFEKAIHDKGDAGETLTSDLLNQTWRGISKKYGGPALTLDPVGDVAWSRIPHMYYNFYVYKYATSYAASLAMADRILTKGKPAADAYTAFLKAGSSKYPVDLLKEAGVDLTTALPVQVAVNKFASIVNEIEKLSIEIQAKK